MTVIHFELEYEKLIGRNIPDALSVIDVVDPDIIGHCINMFNSEILWDGMFTMDEAKNRIENGDRFFVGKYDGDIFGYCWMKKVAENIYELYNVFSKKSDHKKTYGATDMVYCIIKNHIQN